MAETNEIIIEFRFKNERLWIHSEAHQWCIYIYVLNTLTIIILMPSI